MSPNRWAFVVKGFVHTHLCRFAGRLGGMMYEHTLVVALISLGLSLVALGLAAATLTASLRHTISDLIPPSASPIPNEEHRLNEVEKQQRFFFRLIETSLSSRLHAPTHHRLDHLLAKLNDDSISLKEARTLYRLIQERGQELIIEGIPRPDLEFPRLLTLWSLETRLSLAGQPMIFGEGMGDDDEDDEAPEPT